MWISSHSALASKPAVECVADFELSDDRQAVLALLQRLDPVIAAPAGTTCLLDFRQSTYLGPFAAALLMASWFQSIRDNQHYEFRFPPGRKKVGAFLHFSGMLHHIYGDEYPDVSHPDNVTVPVRSQEMATFDTPRPVIDLVKRFAVLSRDSQEYLSNCLNEVVQNVEDHAKSRVGAVSCARFLTKPRKVKIAMVDRGLGIATTLRKQHPEIASTEEALRRVVRGGISAKSRPNNMGIGISNLWDQVTKQLNGQVFIVSEDAIAYSVGREGMRTESVGVRFPGTGVFLTVPIADRQLDHDCGDDPN